MHTPEFADQNSADISEKTSLRQPPLIFGHEFSGTTVKSCARVSLVSDLSEGDRVTANPLVTCGGCVNCTTGRQQLCMNRKLFSAAHPGSNVEFVKIPAQFVPRIPDSLTFENAALTEPAACAVRVLEFLNPLPSDTALVIGLGPIGIFVLQVLKNTLNRTNFCGGCNEDRLKIARDLGAEVISAKGEIKARLYGK